MIMTRMASSTSSSGNNLKSNMATTTTTTTTTPRRTKRWVFALLFAGGAGVAAVASLLFLLPKHSSFSQQQGGSGRAGLHRRFLVDPYNSYTYTYTYDHSDDDEGTTTTTTTITTTDTPDDDEDEDDIMDDSSLRPLFPLLPVDYVGFVAAVLSLILSAGGGIGGGGLLVPIFILILGFPVKHAVSLSNVTVWGGAIANTLLNAPKRHPSANVNRPLIDWNLLAMMEPLTMMGALLGADLIEYLPDVMVVIMLVLLLGFTTIRTLQKAHQMHVSETATSSAKGDNTTISGGTSSYLPKEADALLPAPAADEEGSTTSRGSSSSPLPSTRALSYGGTTQDSSSSSETFDISRPTGTTDCLLSPQQQAEELQQLLQNESHVPWTRIAELSMLFLIVVGLNLLKGSGGALEWLLPPAIDITYGSPAFFWLGKLNVVVIVAFALYIRHDLIRQTIQKQVLHYDFEPGDMIWNGYNTLQYASLFSVAGLFAGLFGIGGGLVKSPLMLEMGVHPAVASATSATMILFTSFTATTSYMVYGQLNYQYAGVFVVIGFVSTVVGQLIMQALLVKYNRNSHIAYSIGLVVGISTLAMTVESVMAIMHRAV